MSKMRDGISGAFGGGGGEKESEKRSGSGTKKSLLKIVWSTMLVYPFPFLPILSFHFFEKS